MNGFAERPLARQDASVLGRRMDRAFRTIGQRIPAAVTPNQVTAFGFVCGIGSATALLFASSTPAAYVAAAALLLGHWFADTLDGLLARQRQQVSQLGYFADHFGDAVVTIAVTVSMFASGGSHLAIGLVSAGLLLLLHVLVHIKAAVVGRMELPALGPQELEWITAAVLVAQAFVSGSQPAGWVSALIGDAGILPRILGLRGGLTLIDVAGVLAATGYALALTSETAITLARLARSDRAGRS